MACPLSVKIFANAVAQLPLPMIPNMIADYADLIDCSDKVNKGTFEKAKKKKPDVTPVNHLINAIRFNQCNP